MNFRKLKPQIICEKCNHIQDEDREYCSACGVSFVFGKPDGWESKPYTVFPSHEVAQQPCLHDLTEPGHAQGISCPCPRCSPWSMMGEFKC